eukprot:776163-Alexandrium_andersonii.AAC.1
MSYDEICGMGGSTSSCGLTGDATGPPGTPGLAPPARAASRERAAAPGPPRLASPASRRRQLGVRGAAAFLMMLFAQDSPIGGSGWAGSPPGKAA